jgi:hypothetical protein
MTSIAAGYFVVVAVSSWILRMFPAEPKLGPILTHITHFQPAQFPLLVIVPALLMDLVLQRSGSGEWVKALLLSLSFISVLLAVQYPLSGFLLESPVARNWFFGADSWYYQVSADAPYRYKFHPGDVAAFWKMLEGLGIAVVAGFVAARISLRWGKWLQRVQR